MGVFGCYRIFAKEYRRGRCSEVYANDTFLGVGHYQIGSIAVRILFEERAVDNIL